MVYLLVQGEIVGRIVLVKAETEEILAERIKICEGEKIVGRLTSAEISVLDTTAFAVISS